MGEVGSISLLKKVRPELDADPTELGFKKEYFDRLDEFEKEKVGRTSYKTISAMTISYIIVFMICWGLIIIFEVSPIICLPVGILWFIQTVMYTCYASKEK